MARRSSRRYARGRHALAECQRSGQKMRYRDLVEDGHVPGLLVHPDWWEPRHPQEIPVSVEDPVALYRPSPEISIGAGYGNPEAGGTFGTGVNQTCAAEPDTATFLPTTTLANALDPGTTLIPLNEAARFSFGQCIYVRRDDDTWFVSKSTAECVTPAFTIPITTGLTAEGSAFSAGNEVYVGVDGGDGGGGTPQPGPDGFIMVLTENTPSTERPNVIVSEDDIETWTEQVFSDSGTIDDRLALVYTGTQWITAGRFTGDGGATFGSSSTWRSSDDGATWTECTLAGTAATEFFAAVQLDTGFTTIWGAGGRQETSSDGISWIELTTGSIEDLLGAARETTIPFNVAVGANGEVLVGANQTDQDKDPPAVIQFNAAATNSNRVFIGGANGIVYYSDNQSDPTPTYVTPTGATLSGPIRGIASDENATVVAVGESRDILVSTDNGASYTTISNVIPTDAELYAVTYDFGTTVPYGFIAVGATNASGNRNATIYTSPDGLTWTLRFISTDRGAARCVRGKNSA